MEKNVRVIDEIGTGLGFTYPKRAKGLIKSGRARYVDENTICVLARPSDTDILEDAIMDQNINHTYNTNEAAATAANAPVETKDKLDVSQILSRIDKIIAENQYITEAFELVKNSSNPAALEDVLSQLSIMVTTKETTNQRVLSLLETMYGDISEDRETAHIDFDIDEFERVVEIITKNCDEDFAANIIADLTKGMFGMGSKNQHKSGNWAPSFFQNGFPFGKKD